MDKDYEEVYSKHEELGHVGKVTPKRRAGFRAEHEEEAVIVVPGDHFIVTVPAGTFMRGQAVRVILVVSKEDRDAKD